MAYDTDHLKDGAGRDDQQTPVRHVDKPFQVAAEVDDVVHGHEAEVGCHGDAVDDVPQGRTAELEGDGSTLDMASKHNRGVALTFFRSSKTFRLTFLRMRDICKIINVQRNVKAFIV